MLANITREVRHSGTVGGGVDGAWHSKGKSKLKAHDENVHEKTPAKHTPGKLEKRKNTHT